jgi:hypothetical protein
LAEQQKENGGVETPLLPRSLVAQVSGTTTRTAREQIQRLIRLGHVAVLQAVDGRRGGTSYMIPKPTLVMLRRLPKTGTKTGTMNAPVVSSSDPTTDILLLTYDDRTISKRLQNLTARLGVDSEFKIGANDLLPLWREKIFEDYDSLALSLEHAVFYLRSDAARGINRPKAWLLAQLRQGYYASPPGFLTWEEQTAAAKLKDAQNRLKRLREFEAQQLETDFELWLCEQTEDQRRKLLHGSLFSDPNSPAAKAILRQKFTELTGRGNSFAEQEEVAEPPR